MTRTGDEVPRALVVFESMFGNTEVVSRAIAEGLATVLEVAVAEAGTAPVSADDFDLLVIGGPTHAFSMSRPSTRDDARAKGARSLSPDSGIREWLAALAPTAAAPAFATFDTREERARHLPGSAARAASRVVRKLGFPELTDPASFYVAHVDGPLLDGEPARARAWGELLATRLLRSLPAPV